jgi:GT2 family glycosyltransferase
MKIGLVIPILNNFRQAVDLIYSIKSDAEVKIFIQPQYRKQVSLAAAWNNGIQQSIDAGCEYIAIFNDDILLQPYGLDRFVEAFHYLPENVILVSANNIYGQLSDPTYIFEYGGTAREEPFNALDHPNYSCFMVKKDFFERIGRFDENFYPAWWEDNDSHYRIHLLGLRAICTTYISCVHYGNQTLKNGYEASSKLSEDYFENKWGSKNRDMNEKFKIPYNNPELTPKDWFPGFA